MVNQKSSRTVSGEERLKELRIEVPTPSEPFGTYVEAVQTGNLVFLTEMLPAEGHGPKFNGRLGPELDVETSRKVAHLSTVGKRSKNCRRR